MSYFESMKIHLLNPWCYTQSNLSLQLHNFLYDDDICLSFHYNYYLILFYLFFFDNQIYTKPLKTVSEEAME